MDSVIKKIYLTVGEDSSVRTLFDADDAHYVVPLYQRAFAWGTEKYSSRENEIVQLMDDIMDARDNGDYYLGSLVVAASNSVYEVIDGQQRLTALFLLFYCLGLKVSKKDALSYACRERSNYTIRRIDDLIADEALLEQPFEQSLFLGVKTIRRKIQAEEAVLPNYRQKLIESLRHVVLFRICVPEDTDLNRYFEIMNTRGEQLEQHDIVKARLMRNLKNEQERMVFSEVWNACRDMTGYVQMHFERNHREELFGECWQDIPDINHLKTDSLVGSDNAPRYSILEVVSPSFHIERIANEIDNDDRIRFESVVGFSHFLLHVLKVFVTDQGLAPDSNVSRTIGEQLDDKLLILAFDAAAKYGVAGEGQLDPHDFSWRFIDCLLKCRFLFDKYILKREYKEEDSDGEWSLQELKVSRTKSGKRPYYAKTEFESCERCETAERRTDLNRMIQACLRVSYTSPRVMHWITRLLTWLYVKKRENLQNLSTYGVVAEGFAAKAVSDFVTSENHEMGVNTPHIVFNYLDFLLWKNEKYEDVDSFDFEFRNSVEHWHPQHPSEGMYGEMEHVNRFGNLCLIQSNINSKFSNLAPDAKKRTFTDMIAKGSLKLRLMASLTVDGKAISATEQWRLFNCEKHEKEMLGILRNAIMTAITKGQCGIV